MNVLQNIFSAFLVSQINQIIASVVVTFFNAGKLFCQNHRVHKYEKYDILTVCTASELKKLYQN